MNKCVTAADVVAEIKEVLVRTETEFGCLVTYVSVQLQNGFIIRDSAQPVSKELYDEEIGKNICMSHIKDKIWFLLGYTLKNSLKTEDKK